MNTLSREELVALVQKIMDAAGTEGELDAAMDLLTKCLPHPNPTDLVYYGDDSWSAEDIVDRALCHEPIRLGEDEAT